MPSHHSQIITRILFIMGVTSSAHALNPDGKILFISNREGNAQIYIMNHDGTEQHALTQGTAENTEPAWSPDGKWIAFTSYRDGNAEIYRMDNDGQHLLRLTNHELADNAPTWTPDGRIIFRSMRERWSNFYVMDATGNNLQPLTTDQIDKGNPVISPDGKWLAFVVHGDKKSEIYTISTNGGVAKNLTGSWSSDNTTFPSWSPDNQYIAYVEAKKPTALNIKIIAPDGRQPTQITDNLYTNAYPLWSPDGKMMAFVSSREGSLTEQARGDIYVMNRDGSNPRNLTNHPAEDNYPVWSADGKSIYFVSLRDGTAQIYGIPPQGGEAVRLTHDNGYNLMIRPWNPHQQPLATANLGHN